MAESISEAGMMRERHNSKAVNTECMVLLYAIMHVLHCNGWYA